MQRVAPRPLAELRQRGASEQRARRIGDDLTQDRQAEPAELDLHMRAGVDEARRLEGHRLVVSPREQGDRSTARHAPQGIGEGTGGGAIEPVDVVDDHEQRCRPGRRGVEQGGQPEGDELGRDDARSAGADRPCELVEMARGQPLEAVELDAGQ